jgi:hypothetical protein
MTKLFEFGKQDTGLRSFGGKNAPQDGTVASRLEAGATKTTKLRSIGREIEESHKLSG